MVWHRKCTVRIATGAAGLTDLKNRLPIDVRLQRCHNVVPDDSEQRNEIIMECTGVFCIATVFRPYFEYIKGFQW